MNESITNAAIALFICAVGCIAYGLLAAWNWIVALRMAARVMNNYDGRSK